LLGQMIAFDDESGHVTRDAIPLAVGTMMIGRAVMAVMAWVITRNIQRFGRKPLFMVGFIALPIRGAMVCLLHKNMWLLLGTQILDGIGDGTYGVMHQVVTQDLMVGTGRFNVALGLVTSCHMAGGALSNLIGETIAEHYGYRAAFLSLGAIGLIPPIIYGCFVPETKYIHNKSRTSTAAEVKSYQTLETQRPVVDRKKENEHAIES